jgi:multidrug efflux pump subunit AcrB
MKDGYELSSIRREDRRRTASITITTKAMDPRRVKARVSNLLDRVELPAGYSIEFDPEAIRKAESLSGTVLFFLLALLLCYMVLGAVNESFTIPLAILFAVPPSLAVPAICLAVAGFPLNSAAACAFVAVSGMTVNAAVLCAGGLRTADFTSAVEPLKTSVFRGSRTPRGFLIYRSLKRNLPALLATSATTIAGAVPFLFLREEANTLVRTMALVTALGVGGSCLCAVSTVPALMLLMRRRMSA